jgi:hypothetical protein
MAGKKKLESNNEPIEKQLWKSADKLRKNIDAAEYKHVVLGECLSSPRSLSPSTTMLGSNIFSTT